MSNLSCANCGILATVGYCEKCERETNDYCASLRSRIKKLEAELGEIRNMVPIAYFPGQDAANETHRPRRTERHRGAVMKTWKENVIINFGADLISRANTHKYKDMVETGSPENAATIYYVEAWVQDRVLHSRLMFINKKYTLEKSVHWLVKELSIPTTDYLICITMMSCSEHVFLAILER